MVAQSGGDAILKIADVARGLSWICIRHQYLVFFIFTFIRDMLSQMLLSGILRVLDIGMSPTSYNILSLKEVLILTPRPLLTSIA
jgi:hypothetical protein